MSTSAESQATKFRVNKILYMIVLLFVGLVLVSPFSIPIIMAGTVALAMWPLMLRLESRGMARGRAAALLTSCFTILISVPFLFFIVKGTMAVTEQLQRLSANHRLQDTGMQGIVKDLRHEIVAGVQKFTGKYEWASFLNEAKINEYLGTVNNFLLKFFQGFLASLPLVFLFLLIMVLCIYSFLHNASGVKRFFQNVFGFSNAKMDELVNVFINDSRQVYISNIATGGIQSLLVATGVALLGQGDFFLVFFVTLILSFIPVVGAAPVAFSFALLAFFRDNNTAAIILLCLGGFTGVIDNFLRPWLASFGESKVPAIVAFICVLGGALLLGFPGLFIGILVGSIIYDTLPIFWNELHGRAPESESFVARESGSAGDDMTVTH